MAAKKETKKVEEKKIEVVVKETKAAVPAAIKPPRAFYIEKTDGVWKLITADVLGDQLINKQTKECDNKALSLENFKIAFAKFYYFGH